MNHIENGGYLWVNGFCDLPNNNSDITEKDLLRDSDFKDIRGMLIDIKHYEMDTRKFVRYCFRKE